jgi:Anti-sigma factor NepR
MASQARTKANARIGRDVQAKIGRQLRAMYAQWLEQELPENLRELLERLSGPPQPQRTASR